MEREHLICLDLRLLNFTSLYFFFIFLFPILISLVFNPLIYIFDNPTLVHLLLLNQQPCDLWSIVLINESFTDLTLSGSRPQRQMLQTFSASSNSRPHEKINNCSLTGIHCYMYTFVLTGCSYSWRSNFCSVRDIVKID